jgi:hypothetical protein
MDDEIAKSETMIEDDIDVFGSEENKGSSIDLEEEEESTFPAPPPSRNLTFRAVIIGGLIGSLVCSSNIYIGLKVWGGFYNVITNSIYLRILLT